VVLDREERGVETASAANGTPAPPTGVVLKRRALISSLMSRGSGLTVANGSAPSISILISRPERRSRTRTRIWGSSSGAPERWRSDIEEQPDPARPEMDLDVIHPDIDALDQGGKQGMLAWSGQFGPVLPDFRGSRDQLTLR
jgi:hypothetical protein